MIPGIQGNIDGILEGSEGLSDCRSRNQPMDDDSIAIESTNIGHQRFKNSRVILFLKLRGSHDVR